MTTPLALELMQCIAQVFDFNKISTTGVEYIEIFVPKTSILSKEEVLFFMKKHPFLSAYHNFILVGEMEVEHKDYVLISIDKNAKRGVS